jgi:hypothetical protein
MEAICEEIRDDMHKIDEKKNDCYAILDSFIHSFKCFYRFY